MGTELTLGELGLKEAVVLAVRRHRKQAHGTNSLILASLKEG
jgi:hypothetical protein